jgi:hypothetical protein
MDLGYGWEDQKEKHHYEDQDIGVKMDLRETGWGWYGLD